MSLKISRHSAETLLQSIIGSPDWRAQRRARTWTDHRANGLGSLIRIAPNLTAGWEHRVEHPILAIGTVGFADTRSAKEQPAGKLDDVLATHRASDDKSCPNRRWHLRQGPQAGRHCRRRLLQRPPTVSARLRSPA